MVRKYALMIIVIFGSFHSAKMEIYACLYVLLLSYYLQDVVKPYAMMELNRLEKSSLIATGLINLSGIYYANIGNVKGLDEIILIMNGMGYLVFFVFFFRLFVFA